LKQEFPNIYDGNIYYLYNNILVNYNATFSDALYLSGHEREKQWVLFNLPSKQVRWQGKFDWRNIPRWSPDGQKIAIYYLEPGCVTCFDDSKLIVINQDGTTMSLTGQMDSSPLEFDKFSWAPDSQSLAAWVITNKSDYKSQLVLFNFMNDTAYDLCIEANLSSSSSMPIWSLDGHFVVTSFFEESEDGYSHRVRREAILIDFQSYKAYRLPGSLLPFGWMKR
jgi:hypothetical protein